MLERKQLHEYQVKGVQHIIDNEFCALFLDMGLGKTVTTLTAIKDLLDNCIISNCLVIAPKKVTQVTWSDEIKAWAHLKDLTISVIDGTVKQRREAYEKKADIYAISRDNIVWLVMEYGGIKLPYDMVVIDELSSFKNHASKRFKALRKVRKFIPRVVGLTGTPSPNGLIDLFAQMYLIDQGQRLGKSITAYRDRFFRPDKRNGDIVFSYALKSPQEETEQQISDLISDITISMKAEDYLKMPDRMPIYDYVELPPKAMEAYTTFEREQIIELINSDTPLTATSAAALGNKLQQMAGGQVYDSDRKVIDVHDEKIEKLKEIVEASNGEPVLVAYAFKHEQARIMEALKEFKPRKLETAQDIADWNEGKAPLMVAHPASIGHGINIQKGGHILVWFGMTWSLELYQQFNARLYRQGQMKPVMIHHIIAKNTIDEKIIKALEGKKQTQDGLMQSIKELMEFYSKK
ncbi:chromatin remodeling complex ATPase [Bacteroides phage EMB1]|nr:chromatin remodeling complex ATPase [Bacteroides phage EMB1]USR81556.1 chromatin remodeling complex ATPase [Bacteroides phage EMB2]